MSELIVQNDFSLKAFNSFGLESLASAFVSIKNEADLIALPELLEKYPQYLILGGGSNVLLPAFFDGLVVEIDIQKFEHKESHDDVLLGIGAGYNWHQLVVETVERNWGGIQNLALIPGKVGAAPIQNIGAYGTELKDVFVCLKAFFPEEGVFRCFNAEECRFGYRDSIFKNELKGKMIISEVWLRLSKTNHLIDCSYYALADYMKKNKISKPGIKDVFEAVIHIRQSKLPDPTKIGNAGSFFKNPVVPESLFHDLQIKFPNIVSFPSGQEGLIKIPAAWLIDQSGFKGKNIGQAGCYEKQPLVLVNRGGAHPQEIFALAGQIQKAVKEKFGILLQPEVNIIQPESYEGMIELNEVRKV